MTGQFYIVVFIQFITCIVIRAKDCDIPESNKSPSLRLRDELFCDYDNTLRPVNNHENITEVELSLALFHFDFNAHSNEFSAKSWILLEWEDEHMTWDEDKYENIKLLFVDAKYLWIPDLTVFNKVSYSSSRLFQGNSQCILRNRKRVLCVTASTIDGICMPDLRYWPFDEQNCTLKIGSWFHHGDELNLTDVTFQKPLLVDNPEWDLVSGTTEIDPGIYKCCPNNTYPSAVFHIVIRRHATALIATIVLPCAVLLSMTIMALWLNPTSCDRIYLTTFNIPCHIMFLLNFTWELPESGDNIPYIIIFVRNSLVMTLITLIETVIVRYLFTKSQATPNWMMTSFSVFINSKIGQLLLFSELNPEDAAINITADDSANLVEVSERPKEWYLLGIVIDRSLFVIYIFIYIIMLIVCVPK